MAISAVIPSGSTNGRNVKIAATATAGTTIHTAHATAIDEIDLDACNTSTGEVKLTVEFGGTTSPDDLVEITIPAEAGFVPVIRGLRLTGSAVLRAFAGSANVINVNARVNRIV